MLSPNKAIYIDSKNELVPNDYAEPYEPGDNQALIRVHYSGINPADLKHGVHFGMNDHVCGYEFSGTVLKSGKGFPYAVGDEVFGSKPMSSGSPFGAHQDLLLAENTTLMAKRPTTLPKDAAAVMSIVTRTAADGLFNLCGIPFPKIDASQSPTDGGILIWGGGSAVGWAAIQLAKAAGVRPIITTANPAHHQTLKDLGATHCFDYRDSEVVANIQSVVDASGQLLKFVLDPVCTQGHDSSSAKCDAIKTAPDARFAGTLPVQSDKNKWAWCLAARAWEMHLPPPIGHVPANDEYESRLVEIVSWAAENYGNGFRVPNLRVAKGIDEGIDAIKASGEGRISFEKVAIQHPF